MGDPGQRTCPDPVQGRGNRVGALHFDLPTFVLACVFTRGARFFHVAEMARRFGEPIGRFVERRLALVLATTALSVVAGIVVLRVF